MTDLQPTVLVAGVGNIFLGDDAFGVEVVERLAQRALPPDVRVVDYGVRSYDLAYALMEPWDLVILADAVPGAGPPGTIYTIEPQLPRLLSTLIP
jgi:hydrogenase maturation protease